MTASAMTHAQSSGKEQFLRAYNREHETTMRVLRAFPADKMDFRPHETSKSARELAWVFVSERGLGTMVFNNAFAENKPAGRAPEPPNDWDAILTALDSSHRDFSELVRTTPDEEMLGLVKFFTAPHTLGDYSRIEFAWFLLHDEIHHRGQFSVYLRMVGGKVPSIYGPTRDEPWM
ncbi:MAG: DinB family protein [Gemmatimonadaceae bacterium]